MFNHYQTIASPLDQFEIRNLFNIDTPLLANMNLSITNIGLYMTIAAFIAFYFSVLATMLSGHMFFNILSGFTYKCVKLQGLVQTPPKPHGFSSIQLKSSSIGTDTVQEWISAKADLKKEYEVVKADYLSTKKELQEANSVLTLCNLVQESQNSAIGPMKQKFTEFFDEESGNDTKQGVKEVVSHLRQEVASLKYEHNTLQKQIADYESKIDK
jgi:hypothetical protein